VANRKLIRVPRLKKKGHDLYHTVLPDGSTVAFRASSDAEARRIQGRIARRLNA